MPKTSQPSIRSFIKRTVGNFSNSGSIEVSEQNFTDESDVFEIHANVNTTVGENPPAIVLNDEPTSSLTTSSLRSQVQKKDDIVQFKNLTQSKQMRITQATLAPTKYYCTNDPKQLLFRKNLAFLAAGTTISGPVLQSEEFKDCIKVADKKLRIPCRNTIASDVKTLQRKFLESISAALKHVRQMTICSDIWTKKGQTSSYLG
ncbi:unnamed protein product, partial [Allacma fusca]